MPHLTLVWLGSKVEQVFMNVHLNLALTILSLPLFYIFIMPRIVTWKGDTGQTILYCY